jgi:hypothetical protein
MDAVYEAMRREELHEDDGEAEDVSKPVTRGA